MNKNLLVMVLLVIILSMAVPLTNYLQQSHYAFTCNNVISVRPGLDY
ncbi:MAG TPA: hypothetical protein PLC88_03450 [Syntrophomonas sp.]|nr:hypothetical protein [Syntrophomonas sp.]HRW11890.1 hypothetical protein [Syntrophomonas sp.]